MVSRLTIYNICRRLVQRRLGFCHILQLLRDGQKEHLKRIPGKYKVGVLANAWLVLDCRVGGVVPSKKDKNLCTLVICDDFRSRQCYMRGNGVA